MIETPLHPQGTDSQSQSEDAPPATVPSRTRTNRNGTKDWATTAVVLSFERNPEIDRRAFRRAQDELIAGEISDEEFLAVWRSHLRHEGREQHFEVLKTVYLTTCALLRQESKP